MQNLINGDGLRRPSWRNHYTHRSEGREVQAALQQSTKMETRLCCKFLDPQFIIFPSHVSSSLMGRCFPRQPATLRFAQLENCSACEILYTSASSITVKKKNKIQVSQLKQICCDYGIWFDLFMTYLCNSHIVPFRRYY